MSKPGPAQLATALGVRSGENLYGVVDAARHLRLVQEGVRLFDSTKDTLFEGPNARDLENYGPLMVTIAPDSGYLESWCDRWGDNAGILVVSMRPRADVRAHLRSIFVVKDETGQEHFFRYYDPRVLRAYLPTCTGEEARTFFGPLDRVLVESDDATTALRFRAGATGATLTEIAM